MRADRLVIAAVLFLGVGLGLVFYFCNGTTGFNVAYPVSATSIHIDITTTGIPVLVGVPLTLAGALLLVIALIAAIVAQFGRRGVEVAPEVPGKRYEPFEQ